MDEDDGGFSSIIDIKSNSNSKLKNNNTPIKNSRLASLFSNDLASQSIGNTSLSYKPMKQNQNKNIEKEKENEKEKEKDTNSSTTQTQKNNSTMALIHACPIILFAYDTNNTTPIEKGKRGTALLSNNNKIASLLVYEPTSKQQDINIQITNNFNFSVTSDLYFIMFYDINNIQWALRFDNTDSTIIYIRHLMLLKESVREEVESKNLMYQDLVIGNASRSINNGDTVKLSYTMYLLTDTSPRSISTMVGTIPIEKPKTVKLGDKKEIFGIEEGLIGMKKLSSRFLIIPPEKAYGSVGGGAIPPNSWLAVEMTVVKVKFADEDINSVSLTIPTHPHINSNPTVSEPIDSERRESADHKSSDLKSRMAKLAGGKSLFDVGSDSAIQKDKSNLVNAYSVASFKQDELYSQNINTNPANNPVTEDTSSSSKHEPSKQDEANLHNNHLPNQLNANNAINSIQSPVHTNYSQQHQNQVQGNNGMIHQGYGMQYGSYTHPNGYYYHNNSCQSQTTIEEKDSRVLNSSLNEKLDKILNSIEKISVADSSSLSPANIIASLQNLIVEKEKLRAENAEANEKIHNLQIKVSELHEKNRKSLEENTKLIEKQFSTMQSDAELRQSQVQELQQKLMNQLQLHQSDLSDKTSKIVNLQSDLQKETRIKLDLEQDLFTSKSEITNLQARLIMLNEDLLNKNSQISKLKSDMLNKESFNKLNEENFMLSQIESTKIALDSSQQEVIKLSEELKIEKNLRSESDLKTKKLIQECDILKEEINNLNAELISSNDSYKSSESIKLNLEHHIETLKNQLVDAQKSSTMLSNQFELEKSALSNISSNNLIESQELLSRLTAEKSELENALENAKVKESRLIESAKQRIENLSEQLAEAESEKTDIITQTKEFKVKLKEQSSAERKELLQSAMNYLYITVSKTFKSNTEVVDKLKNTIKNATKKILSNPDDFDFEDDENLDDEVKEDFEALNNIDDKLLDIVVPEVLNSTNNNENSANSINQVILISNTSFIDAKDNETSNLDNKVQEDSTISSSEESSSTQNNLLTSSEESVLEEKSSNSKQLKSKSKKKK